MSAEFEMARTAVYDRAIYRTAALGCRSYCLPSSVIWLVQAVTNAVCCVQTAVLARVCETMAVDDYRACLLANRDERAGCVVGTCHYDWCVMLLLNRSS